MADPNGMTPNDRVREIEMRLWEEVGAQLKGVTEAMKDMTHEMRDVRDRLIRMESQDQPGKVAKLEDQLREMEDELTRVEKAASDALVAAKTADQAARTQIEATFAAEKLALEKRLTRMEIIIAPLTCGGSAILAAIAGLLVAHFGGG